jgi:hypothetical protein
VSDLPIHLSPELASRLAEVLDVEGKLARGLEALGPVAGRDVLLIDAEGASVAAALAATGARIRHARSTASSPIDAPSGSADVVVGLWSSFRGVDPAEIADADRILRPGGRLLVVHDYGRDDVSRLFGERPEYGAWSHRTGPFLTGGFRVRVLHCFWTFDSIEHARGFLEDAFGDVGVALGETLRRPRLSYNLAIYHRDRGGADDPTQDTADGVGREVGAIGDASLV